MLEALLRNPIPAETLDTNPEIRQQVEKALAKKYPGIDVTYDPAHDLLEGKFRDEMNEYIDLLTQPRNRTPDIDPVLRNPIPAETLDTNPEIRQRVEKALARMYPDIDVTYDPAYDLLEGQYRDELDEYLDMLISTR